MEKIDMVMPCLLPNDAWYEQYAKVKGKEHPGRVRDLGILKYTLRSISKNLPWLNKLYICFFDESQVPEWLNRDCSRLKIIFHKDFIPNEHLPSFNSELFTMYYHSIPELSEYFISTSDDDVFIKPVPSTIYYDNGQTIHHPTQKIVHNYNMLTKAQFGKIEKNNYMFLNNYVNDGKMYHFWTFHLPIPVRKSFQEFMWYKFGNDFNAALAHSPIRSDHTVNNWLFYNFEEFFKLSKNVRVYDKYKSGLYHLYDNMTQAELTHKIDEYYILSINDGDAVNKNFDKVKNIVLTELDKVFPDKCEFEK